MKTALLVISDRPHLLQETLLSAAQHLPAFHHLVHVDDQAHELGFAGAIQEGWDRVLATDADFIFHLEGDFTFNQRVPLDFMVRELTHGGGDLAQIALLRQPWNQAEREAGGIIELDPGAYTPTRARVAPHRLLTHRKFWTTNPSLYPRWVAERGWPQQPQSEGIFGIRLFEDLPECRSAFWGDGTPWVTHIGHERTGHGY